ncbi:MAG: PilN domain-containing protein [Myxococcota bacterium]|nr:PilN domain-containing protein [Myxococcota bacterium]
MIRINLLPQAKRQARGAAGPGIGSSGWVVAYAAAALVTCVVLALVYFSKDSELSEQRARNAALESQIAQVTQQSANIEEVRAALQRSTELEQVVAELERARFGPTRVLMELSSILSAAGGPTIDPQRLEQLRRGNPLAGFNRSWDTRRLWLTSFEESDRRVRIRGVGKTNEDVAEFLRRLTLSESFGDVHLDKTEAIEEQETHLPLVAFELTATVRY